MNEEKVNTSSNELPLVKNEDGDNLNDTYIISLFFLFIIGLVILVFVINNPPETEDLMTFTTFIVIIGFWITWKMKVKNLDEQFNILLKNKNFQISKHISVERIEGLRTDFVVDNNAEQIAIYSANLKNIKFKIINYKDIIKFEYDSNNPNSGNLAGSMAGGLLFGTTGAIIGSNVANVKIHYVNIYINDLDAPLVIINCSSADTAKEIIAALTVIKHQEQNK